MAASAFVARSLCREVVPTAATEEKAEASSWKLREGISTLIDFRYNPHQVAENGQHGMGKLMHGADAEDRIVKVPAGTIVRAPENRRRSLLI